MTDLDLDRIEGDARAATQGEWAVKTNRAGNPTFGLAEKDGYLASWIVNQEDARHIANMDPPKTIALVAALRKARADWQTLSAVYERVIKDGDQPLQYEKQRADRAEAEATRLRAVVEAIKAAPKSRCNGYMRCCDHYYSAGYIDRALAALEASPHVDRGRDFTHTEQNCPCQEEAK